MIFSEYLRTPLNMVRVKVGRTVLMSGGGRWLSGSGREREKWNRLWGLVVTDNGSDYHVR